MTDFRVFSYEELLTANGQKDLHPNLLIDDNSPPLLIIIRLLSGSLKLTNNYSNLEINCRNNYFTSDLRNYGQKWRRKFPKLIDESLTSDDISNFISKNKHANKAFYQNILSEISHYIYETKKGSHTTAFIYIYRLLEKIAYAFPLIYTSKTQDFIQSFNELKDLMTGTSEKKELGFYKKFIEVLYKNDPIFLTSIDMNIYDGNSKIQEQIFKSLKNVLEDSVIHGDTLDPVKLSIKYGEMGSFIITIRNRFFHNMNNHSNNIQSGNIADSDLIFLSINDCALQWISTIFLGLLTHSISITLNNTP